MIMLGAMEIVAVIGRLLVRGGGEKANPVSGGGRRGREGWWTVTGAGVRGGGEKVKSGIGGGPPRQGGLLDVDRAVHARVEAAGVGVTARLGELEAVRAARADVARAERAVGGGDAVVALVGVGPGHGVARF